MFPQGCRVTAPGQWAQTNLRQGYISVGRVRRSWLIAGFMESDWGRREPIWSAAERHNHKAVRCYSEPDSNYNFWQQSGCRTSTQVTLSVNESELGGNYIHLSHGSTVYRKESKGKSLISTCTDILRSSDTPTPTVLSRSCLPKHKNRHTYTHVCVRKEETLIRWYIY